MIQRLKAAWHLLFAERYILFVLDKKDMYYYTRGGVTVNEGIACGNYLARQCENANDEQAALNTVEDILNSKL